MIDSTIYNIQALKIYKSNVLNLDCAFLLMEG